MLEVVTAWKRERSGVRGAGGGRAMVMVPEGGAFLIPSLN